MWSRWAKAPQTAPLGGCHDQLEGNAFACDNCNRAPLGAIWHLPPRKARALFRSGGMGCPIFS
eukprot:12913007-Alexandrium_andersonii.AAC.1